jgi:hypothetical protein
MTRFAAPRAALLPAFHHIDSADLSRALADGGPALESLILKQQLGPTWHARTHAKPFAESRSHAAMLYMRQAAAQREIDQTFARHGIRYALFKGAATRDLIYDDPSVRICYDIDVLVAPDQRTDAARALVDAGYRLRVDPAVASHEVALQRDLVSIDLHWELLRPGRTPASLTTELLSRRRQHDGRWILSEADALFVLLVHPAFAKHLSTSQMGLHRVADVAQWLQKHHVDWAALRQALESSGLKTAAWTMLSLVRMLSSPEFARSLDDPLRSLRPAPARAAYLNTWLSLDMSARLSNLHAARLIGLSVFLHDQPSGAWRALRGWQQSREARSRDAAVFDALTK